MACYKGRLKCVSVREFDEQLVRMENGMGRIGEERQRVGLQ